MRLARPPAVPIEVDVVAVVCASEGATMTPKRTMKERTTRNLRGAAGIDACPVTLGLSSSSFCWATRTSTQICSRDPATGVRESLLRSIPLKVVEAVTAHRFNRAHVGTAVRGRSRLHLSPQWVAYSGAKRDVRRPGVAQTPETQALRESSRLDLAA